MKRQCLFSFIAAIVLVVGFGASRAFAAPKHAKAADPPPCPTGGTPAPGSTVTGGLVVDGACILHNVTVHGGIVVLSPTGGSPSGLELENCSVFDGIVVEPGAELDAGQTLGGGVSVDPTGSPNTLRGGITIDAASAFNLFGATIDGGVTVTGTLPGNGTICADTITGDVVLTDATFTGFLAFADSDDAEPVFPTKQCTTNTITGSVDIINSQSNDHNFLDFEENDITGNVVVLNSTTEFGGNTVDGNAICIGSTIINQGFGTPTDIIANAVVGFDTCKPLVDTK
jgi:hypothetical protein